MKKKQSLQRPALFLFFFLLLLIAYAPSFQVGWHFDDLPNILNNTPLHLTELTLHSFKRTFFAYPEREGTLLRPISNLSFALNWFFHQDKAFGYHLVNFLIHFLATIFLFKSCLLLLSSPKMKGKVQGNPFLIATLAALFWALNPVQTQAVTYIVQRMASLAAMFTIIGIWCYLKGRLQPSCNKKQLIYYLGVLSAFFLALGSKENAILFPASIVLIELFFFRKALRFSKQNIILLVLGLFFILSFTILLKGPGVFHGIFASYSSRSFTPGQRVLTEFRIVLFYLSLLFYPAPFRLSLIHDIQVSTSFFHPISTFFSFLLIGFLTVSPFFFHKRYPLLSFAILFFLLNHSVESTFLNLELIFEHRNYLPSFFLFLPAASFLTTLTNRYRQQNKSIFFLFNGTIALLIIFLVFATMARNKVWLTKQSLWSDSLKKAPKSSGPYINLGHYYLFQENNLQKAFELNFLSLDKESATPWKTKFWAYNNMGYIMERGEKYNKALQFYDRALAVSKDTPYGKYNISTLAGKAQVLWKTGQKKQAMEIMNELTDADPTRGKYLQRYGEMLISENRVNEGITVLQSALSHSEMVSNEYSKSLLDFSLVYARSGFTKKSAFYMRLADILGVPVVPSSLCFIEASLLAERRDKADQAMNFLLSKITWAELVKILEGTSPNTPALPFDYPLLLDYAVEWIAEQEITIK
ncbi:Tetratricopeptide repeat-containing protein [Candidatus Electrothrix laxa]